MDSGLIFPHPMVRLMAGDAAARRYGVIDSPARKGDGTSIRNSFRPAATKNPVRTNHRPVPQSDTGGQGENPKAFGRTLVKELGKMTPYPRYKGCLREQAAENRL